MREVGSGSGVWYPAEESAAATRAREEEEERQLQAARDAFPRKRLFEIAGGGFLAVPAGTGIVQGLDLDDLVRRLREAERGRGRFLRRLRRAGR